MAATTNNAIHEYYDFAEEDDIWTPNEGLQVVISTWGDDGVGGAPMLHQGLDQSIIYSLSQVILFPHIPWGTLGTLVMELFQQVAPDVTYSYGNIPSDEIKATIYHEMAHASHFTLVGNTYWHKIRDHEVRNAMASGNPYGTPGNFVAGSSPGRVAIAESWGEHIGLSYAHRRYGLNNSLPPGVGSWEIY